MKVSTNAKLRMAQISGVFATFTPLAIAIGVDHETYFATKAAGWSLTSGGILAVILVALSAMGKTKNLFNSGFKVATFIFVFSVLLSPIVLNLQFLSGMLLAGEATNSVIVQPKVAKLKKQLGKEDLTDAIRRANHAGSV
ncbi:MAG: hypothetical protein IJD77_00985 [Clostridia bacterium]|nr:hypothetical protein [Clostridia bacterium]